MTHPVIRFLVVTTLLLLTGDAIAGGQRNTSCLKKKFNLISIVDLNTISFEAARELCENGDTAAAEKLIRAYFMGKNISCTLSGLGKCPDAVERGDGILANRYRFWTHDEYELPEDLKWNENPPSSANWAYYLLSFEFLWILNEAYLETGNKAYLEKGRRLIEDFARDNLDPKSLPSRNVWYDHPVSNRLVYLVDYWLLYQPACRPTTEFTSLMLELLWRHARFLMTPANYNSKTNHGLFSCLALERLAFAFPEMTESDEYLEFSIARFKKQLEDNFDKDGVHREYSPWYQVWIAGLLKIYREDCELNGVQLPGTCLVSIDKVIQVGHHFFHPDRTVALFGDSDLYLTEKMMDVAMESHPWLNFISTKGREGEMPEIYSAGLTDSHIYIMRSGWGEKRKVENESCLMAFFTPKASNHDHEDLMEFELYSKGAKWITDLGRYNYNYRSAKRKYIVSKEAHNGVIPFRFVTPAEKQGERVSITPGRRNKPENEGRSTKNRRRLGDKGKFESEMNIISRETDPEKKTESYRALLEAAEGDDAMCIKVALAFVLAEELGDNEAAAVQLNDIISDSTDMEHVALARQYLAIIGGPQDESIKIEENSRRDILRPDDKIESNRHRVVEAKTELKEVRPPSGKGPEVLTWISNPEFDYLEGYMRYEKGFFHHSRAILLIKPAYFLVVDRFSSLTQITKEPP